MIEVSNNCGLVSRKDVWLIIIICEQLWLLNQKGVLPLPQNQFPSQSDHIEAPCNALRPILGRTAVVLSFFFLPAIALGWDFLYTAIEPPAGLVDLYCGVLRRGLGVVESALNVVWTNCLWNTLAIVLPLGCVYVFSMFLCYFRALHAHDTGNIWRQKRGLYFFMWKHRILTGCAGQLLAFWKISVGPLHQGLSQWEQCDALKSVLL